MFLLRRMSFCPSKIGLKDKQKPIHNYSIKSFLISPIWGKVWLFLFLTPQHKCFSYCIYCILLLYWLTSFLQQGFPSGGSDVKESAYSTRDPGSIPGSGRSLGEGIGLLTPVFLPGEFHGQRSLVSYSPRGRKELDTAEWLKFHFFLQQDTNPSLDGCSFPIFSHVIWVEFTPPLFS